MSEIIWKDLPSVSSGKYYQRIDDPHQTHALYGVNIENVPKYKEYLKSHGAKKFRVVKNRYGYGIICFEWVRDYAAEEKKRQEKILVQEKWNNAKLIVDSSEYGKIANKDSYLYSRMVQYIRDGEISINVLNAHHVDELMSADNFKSKDYSRIYDIICKSIKNSGKLLVENIDYSKAISLATQMSNKIKSGEKMLARKTAAENLGLGFIARCFNMKN